MSSPNEPGDRAGQPAGPRHSDPGTQPPARQDSPEVPPWQRAAGRGQQSGARPPIDAPPRPPEPVRNPEPPRPVEATRPVEPVRPDQRPPASPAKAPGPAPSSGPVDNRISRYVTGTAAPAALQPQKPPAEPEAPRSEPARTKEFASELPDLSNAAPRSTATRTETQTSGANRPASGRVQVGSRSKGGPVRATMQIRRVDPWSALKVSLLLSVVLFFVWMIAVALLYLVLGGMGVWSKLNSNVGDLLNNAGGGGGELVSAGSIFGGALLIGLVNIVLLTAMATLGAFVYNLTTDIVGGVEVTLADRD